MNGYVIYHMKSKHYHDCRVYATLAAAKSAYRHLRNAEEYAITDAEDYFDNIDYEYVGSRGYKVRASTLMSCDPNTDLYWSR